MLAAFFSLLSTSLAQAQVPPPADFNEYYNYGDGANDPGGYNYYGPGTFGGTYTSSQGTVIISDQIHAEPVYVSAVQREELGTSMQVSVSGEQVDATANLSYDFTIVGPANVSVPIVDSGMGSYTSSTPQGGSIAWAKLIISGPNGALDYLYTVSDSVYGPAQPPWSIDAIDYYQTNTAYSVQLSVAASEGGTAGTATATIDPTMYIDPTFAAANPGYTLEFSPNLEEVPEPSTWALLLGGLGLLAFWRIRTRRLI